MADKLHVIYVPGLGDTTASGQRTVVTVWRIWGVVPELCQMHWSHAEGWDTKFARLLDRIDVLHAAGHQVGLVGSSAGATAVINAFAVRHKQVVGCVLIAGKINNPQTIGETYRRENPDFIDSATGCQTALGKLTPAERRRILSLYAAHDGIVPKRDSQIPSTRNHTVPTIGHSVTIATQLVLGAPAFLHFLKHQAK